MWSFIAFFTMTHWYSFLIGWTSPLISLSVVNAHNKRNNFSTKIQNRTTAAPSSQSGLTRLTVPNFSRHQISLFCYVFVERSSPYNCLQRGITINQFGILYNLLTNNDGAGTLKNEKEIQ